MSSDPSIPELLNTSRELTPEEKGALQRTAARSWESLTRFVGRQARAAYSVANPDQLAVCTSVHMTEDDRRDMVSAELYICPGCGMVLKDRGTPVAASILLERQRIRELYRAVEEAETSDEYIVAHQKFRRALGMS